MKSWFEDPEWDELKERVKLRSEQDVQQNSRASFNKNRYKKETPSVQLPDEPHKVELKINFSLPPKLVARLKKLCSWLVGLSKYRKKITKKQLAIAGATTASLALVILLINVFKSDDKKAATPDAQSNTQSEALTISHDPPFEAALPEGKTIDREKIFYESNRNFVKYDDQVDGVNITISQQPIPDAFKADPETNTKKLAQDSGVKEEILLAGTTMYYGSSEQGLQTIILTKKDLLIFINAPQDAIKESLELYAANLE